MKKLRTRIAPSPTGYLHNGVLRTALYTYLLAKKNDGVFILRIEDTDQKREVEGATDIIMSSLKTAGLMWDEGPDVGGRLAVRMGLAVIEEHHGLVDADQKRVPVFRRDAVLVVLRHVVDHHVLVEHLMNHLARAAGGGPRPPGKSAGRRDRVVRRQRPLAMGRRREVGDRGRHGHLARRRHFD